MGRTVQDRMSPGTHDPEINKSNLYTNSLRGFFLMQFVIFHPSHPRDWLFIFSTEWSPAQN